MKLEEKLAEVQTFKNENNECKLLKRLLAVEKLDKAPIGCLVKSVTIYLEGKIHLFGRKNSYKVELFIFL